MNKSRHAKMQTIFKTSVQFIFSFEDRIMFHAQDKGRYLQIMNIIKKKKLSNNFQAFVDVHAHEKLFKRKIVFYITSQFYNLPTKKYL